MEKRPLLEKDQPVQTNAMGTTTTPPVSRNVYIYSICGIIFVIGMLMFLPNQDETDDKQKKLKTAAIWCMCSGGGCAAINILFFHKKWWDFQHHPRSSYTKSQATEPIEPPIFYLFSWIAHLRWNESGSIPTFPPHSFWTFSFVPLFPDTSPSLPG